MERDRQREIKKFEASILKHKKEMETLAEKLSNPEIHADYVQIKSIGDEMRELKKQIAEAEAGLRRNKQQ